MTFEFVDRTRARRISVPGLPAFSRRLAAAIPRAPDATVTVCLAGDALVRRLNGTFRGKDETTDVLAFPADPAPQADGARHLGDVVISLPQARRQAKRYARSPGVEVRHLLIHGCLHLLGYDHEVDDGTMRRLESRLVRRLLPGDRGR